MATRKKKGGPRNTSANKLEALAEAAQALLDFWETEPCPDCGAAPWTDHRDGCLVANLQAVMPIRPRREP